MHAILSRLFVWNLLWRGKLLSTLRPEIACFFFFFFPPFGAMDQGNFRAATGKTLMRWKLQCSMFYVVPGKDDLCACRSMTPV